MYLIFSNCISTVVLQKAFNEILDLSFYIYGVSCFALKNLILTLFLSVVV